MTNPSAFFKERRGQSGTAAVVVAVSVFSFIGFADLAIPLSHLFVVRDELQNGADAGALAGARFLYTSDRMAINAGAN